MKNKQITDKRERKVLRWAVEAHSGGARWYQIEADIRDRWPWYSAHDIIQAAREVVYAEDIEA